MVIKTKRKTILFNKKAQIKINQMAFLLIGVTIFFALVGMFALTLKLSSSKDADSEIRRQNAFLLAAKIANSPEFSCGEAFGGERSNCIDLDKVMMLKQEIDKYETFWGTKNIEIRVIYPKSIKVTECTLTNYPNCNLITLMDDPGGYDISTFVSLCRKELKNGLIQNRCKLGKIFVRYEEAK